MVNGQTVAQFGQLHPDVATARNARVRVWALPYGYNMGEPIEACAPDRVIADFSVLVEKANRSETLGKALA